MTVTFPSRALVTIFSHLDARESARAALVCRSWKQAREQEDQRWEQAFTVLFPHQAHKHPYGAKASFQIQLQGPKYPVNRPIQHLDNLLLLTHEAISLGQMAQDFHDVCHGACILGVAPLHAGISSMKAYVMTWMSAPQEGARRGQQLVCSRASSTGGKKIFESLCGTLLGSAVALGAAPITSVLVACKEGVDVLGDDVIFATTRITQGLIRFVATLLEQDELDNRIAALLRQRDALVLERARDILGTPTFPLYKDNALCRSPFPQDMALLRQAGQKSTTTQDPISPSILWCWWRRLPPKAVSEIQ